MKMYSFLYIFIFCFAMCLHAFFQPIVTWDLLKEFNYETRDLSSDLSDVLNKSVEISGFIVPLELDDHIDTVKEFLLVPNPLACIHVPPPPPNQMILVHMKKAIPLDMDLRGVTIKGVLRLAKDEVQDQLVGFELAGKSAKEADIDFEDPFDEILNEHILNNEVSLDTDV